MNPRTLVIASSRGRNIVVSWSKESPKFTIFSSLNCFCISLNGYSCIFNRVTGVSIKNISFIMKRYKINFKMKSVAIKCLPLIPIWTASNNFNSDSLFFVHSSFKVEDGGFLTQPNSRVSPKQFVWLYAKSWIVPGTAYLKIEYHIVPMQCFV